MEKNKKNLVIVESPNKSNFNVAKLSVGGFNCMNDLKQHLLSLDIFYDNEYLDAYCSLIYNNKNTKRQKFKTERHHIVPRTYYRHLGDEIWMTYRSDVRVNKNNIVNLLYKDHVLAHFYLYKMSKESWLKESMAFAFYSMSFYSKLSDEDVADLQLMDKIQQVYYDYKLASSKLLTGVNLGKKLSEETKIKLKAALTGVPKSNEHREALKAARNLHSTTKGKKSIYNPQLNKVKYVSNEDINKYLADGWVLGGKPLSQEVKDKIGNKNKNSLKGKKHQKLEGQKYTGLVGQRVMCVETQKIFDNVKQASEWLEKTKGIKGKIKDCCSNSREMSGGYHWQFYEGGD